jgi:hypothetical protein
MKRNTGSQQEDDVTSASRRVADALHEQVDSAASAGRTVDRRAALRKRQGTWGRYSACCVCCDPAQLRPTTRGKHEHANR